MCVFCDLAARRIPSEIVFEDDEFLAFNDVRPVSPIHVLVVPKKHIPSLANVDPENEALVGKLLPTARRVAALLDGTDVGYRIVINTGTLAGQSVAHLHAHVLGGRALGCWPPR